MTVVKLKILFDYPVSGFVLQSASRCESRAKCRDTSMHWRMIRIDTDFRFKNTDSPHEIVACLITRFAVLSVANEVPAALPSCFDGPVGQYKGRHALLLVAPSRVDVVGSPLSRTMPCSRSQVLRSPARARAFCML